MLAGFSLGLARAADAAAAQPTAKLIEAPGSPFLTIGAFDLKAMGYVVEEYVISGTASAYKLTGEATRDGGLDSRTAERTPRPTPPAALGGDRPG